MCNAIDQPLRFEPYLRPMIWGGRRITRFLGKNPPTVGAGSVSDGRDQPSPTLPDLPEPIGESWEVSDHALHRSQLATASHFGVTLRQLMSEHRHDLLGPAADRFAIFPWLIKLLDANEWLSVQVHPDEVAVKKLWPGESAKTEAWFVLDAGPESRILAGLKPGVGPQELRQAIDRNNIADCLHSFTPRAGDLVFIPAGTVHALGRGILLAEIQQTSDATFRLFDWNRLDAHGQPRKLHIEESFASIHWDQDPIEPNRADSPHHVTCPYFEIERLQRTSSFALGGIGRLQAMIVGHGQGRFENGEFVMPGDVWVLPAVMPAMTLNLETPMSGLLCSLPG